MAENKVVTTILGNLDVKVALSPFEKSLGNAFDKIVLDVKSVLGRLTDKDVTYNNKSWTATNTFALKNSEGRTIQLAKNNPACLLLCIGMQLNAMATKCGGYDIDATIPRECDAWIKHHNTIDKPSMQPA